MKALIFSIIYMVFQQLTAQDFQGIATYRMNQKMEIKMDSTRHTEAMTKELRERLSKQFDREFTLQFNKNESLFKQEEKLEVENPQAGGGGVMVVGGFGQFPLYKNVASKTFVRQEDLMGKRFLVKDSLSLPDWQMHSEQKMIGKYTAYKATWTREVERSSWDSDTGETKNTVELVTTAWYTPEIPVSHGPQNYWGLPGLILEIQEGNLSYLCTGITLNPKTKFNIEIPNKGKEIDLASFTKLRDEKTREMIETYRGGGRPGANAVRMRVN